METLVSERGGPSEITVERIVVDEDGRMRRPFAARKIFHSPEESQAAWEAILRILYDRTDVRP